MYLPLLWCRLCILGFDLPKLFSPSLFFFLMPDMCRRRCPHRTVQRAAMTFSDLSNSSITWGHVFKLGLHSLSLNQRGGAPASAARQQLPAQATHTGENESPSSLAGAARPSNPYRPGSTVSYYPTIGNLLIVSMVTPPLSSFSKKKKLCNLTPLHC